MLLREKNAESLLSSLVELSNRDFSSLEISNSFLRPSSVLLLRNLLVISEDGRWGFVEIIRDTFARLDSGGS